MASPSLLNSGEYDSHILMSRSPYSHLLENISPPYSLSSSPDCPSLDSSPSFNCDDIGYLDPGDDIDLINLFLPPSSPGSSFDKPLSTPTQPDFSYHMEDLSSHFDPPHWMEYSSQGLHSLSMARIPRPSVSSSIYDPIPTGPFSLSLPTSSYDFPDAFGSSDFGSQSARLSQSTPSIPLSRIYPTETGFEPISSKLASSDSPSSTASLHDYGIEVRSNSKSKPQVWRCAYPDCTSRILFTRGCDLRKHFRRHSKRFFCTVRGCPRSEAAILAAAQAEGRNPDVTKSVKAGISSDKISGCFSSKKDRSRHEARHNPKIRCEWNGPNGEQCKRVFSRVDNMRDHVRRIHSDEH